jgi:hypothetical protein
MFGSAAATELILEQRAEQLHRHVLEGQRRSVGQGLDPQAGLECAQRHDGVAAKVGARVGAAAQRAQVVGRNVVDVQRQDLERQVGVRQRPPALQHGGVDLWIALRQVQAAVGREPLEQDLAERARCRVAARADVLHAARRATPRAACFASGGSDAA